jgi:chromosome partitioning protein
MKVIAVIGQKGGTGKTTTAQNLSVAATQAGHTVALVDLDSQPTSANWGDRRESEQPAVVSAQVARLRNVLSAARKQGVTMAILDTPPRTAEGSLEAAKLADLVLVPVRPMVNDLETLTALKELVLFAGAPPTWVVINAAPVQGDRAVEARQVAESLGFQVAPVLLHQRSAFGDAPAAGLGVTEYEPSGKAAEEVQGLYKFMHKQLKLQTPEPLRAHG